MNNQTLALAQEILPNYRTVCKPRLGLPARFVIALHVFGVGLFVSHTFVPVRGLAMPIGPMFAATAAVRLFLGKVPSQLCAILMLMVVGVLAFPYFVAMDTSVVVWVASSVFGMTVYAFSSR